MNRTQLHLLGIILLIFSQTRLSAQAAEPGSWMVYSGNFTFKENWNWVNEVHFRNYDILSDLQQVALRTGIGYNLSQNNTNLLMGYTYIYSEKYIKNADDKKSSDENRFHQQIVFKQNVSRLYLQNRVRVEERFFSDEYKTRIRYSLVLNLPLNNKTMKSKTLYLATSNEIFLQVQKKAYDQNRLYGGIGYIINKNFKVEAGYLRQMTSTTNRNQFQIAVSNTFPL